VRIFGPEPADIEACERWLRAVTDGAAYLEFWECDDFAENIVDSGSDDQESHRRRVLASIESLNSDIRIRDDYLDTIHSMSDEVLAHMWNQEMVLEQ
jgi:hypothetical protein